MTDWLFIHNPRTGGHSIRHALGLDCEGNLHEPPAWLPPAGWSFGFVRNPWARLVSLYNLLRRLAYVEGEFGPWLLAGTRRLLYEPKGTMGLQVRPQSWWVGDCDFVGRYERLQDDFDLVCDHIGMERRPLPHLESTRVTDYHEWYDDETRYVVAERFTVDIERWGYEF